MPHLDANGLRFHVQVLPPARQRDRDDPSGPTPSPRPQVVMLHGLVVDNLSAFYYTIANPMALTADTHLYDLRGHGRSERPCSGYAIVDHVADLHGLIGAWGIAEPVHLVGNSFGGAVALAYAHLFPQQVASLVLVEAHFATTGWGDQMATNLVEATARLDLAMVKQWVEQHATRKLSRRVDQSERLLRETSLIEDLQREQPFSPEALASIGCPTLALYGERSDIVDRGRDLARHLPRCQLEVVPDTTHGLLFEATPLVRDRAVAWVAAHAAVTAGA